MQLALKQNALLHQPQTVEQYFATFNRGDFLATSQLFSAVGQLLPPFEEPLLGQEAIQTYLESEASGMEAIPKEAITESVGENHQRVIVKGKVKAVVFTVNVAWIFDLDPQGRIEQVEVKLLASLQELLNLKRD